MAKKNPHLENFTKTQIRNLNTLAAFLASDDIPPPIFNISSFISLGTPDADTLKFSTDEPSEVKPETYNICGTTACAVGHGPLAGIRAFKTEDWFEYSYRTMCPEIEDTAWEFMFSGEWQGSNNNAKATSARILYFLENDVPSEFNHDPYQYFYEEECCPEMPWLKKSDVL